MPKKRFSYFIITVGVIILGLLSRKINGIPLFIGDFLYAVMVYFGVRFLLIYYPQKKAVIIATVFCYSIELLQLYDANWISTLRNTLFGRYVLGQGFLWIDILAYSLGILSAYFAESFVSFEKNKFKKLQ